MRNTVPSAISTRNPTTISRGVENLLGNTFSRIVATQVCDRASQAQGSIPAGDSVATLVSETRYNPREPAVRRKRKDALTQLTDSYNRKMDYLRISVTDRCNFRCQYCMPEDIQFQDKSHILTLEEMLTFAEACLELGVTKVRVTGGEPLVRRGSSCSSGGSRTWASRT